MKSPVISVIIPVFNAQCTLPAAMDSIFGQNIQDIEIILINDGSRDDSLQACEQYAQNDSRVKVINQANSGPSAARNAGLRVATGQFLSFVDSDDTLAPDAYVHMLDAAQRWGVRMVIAHFNLLLGKCALNRGRVKQDVVLKKDAFMGVLAQKPASSYFASVWNKLYSRELVQGNGIIFDKTITWGEDMHFNLLCYNHVDKVAFAKEPVYNYRLTLSGQAFCSLFTQPRQVLAVRLLHYRTLKELYLHTGCYRRYRARIYWFLFDVFV